MRSLTRGRNTIYRSPTMSASSQRHQSLSHAVLPVLLFCVVCAVSITVFCQVSPAQPGAVPQVAAPQGASFDVVSIRQNKSGKGIGMNFDPDGFTATNMSLQAVIMFAYKLVDPELMFGGKLLPGAPSWMSSDKYDIRAKISASDLTALQRLAPGQQFDEKRLMLQSLLADRFKLIVRNESKPRSCFALAVDKNGLKIKEAAPSDPASHDGDMLARPGSLKAQAAPLSQLIFYLTNQLRCPVQDRTGLTGKYAFSLQHSLDQAPGSPSSTDALEPDLFTAIRDQLGLRLIPVTIPIEGIFIEHVERPSEN